MNAAAPQVSVVMPAYNSAAWIRDAVASVKAQTFEDWELIVVDDASDDDTPAVLRELAAGDARIHTVSLSNNQGAGEARNAGIAKARGRYLAFLDSDDRWLPEKLERQLRFMRDGDRAFTFTRYIKVNAQGERLGGAIEMPERTAYRDVLKHCCMATPTVMFDREQLNDIRMPALTHGEDHVLWLSMLKQTPYAYCLQEELTRVLIRPESLSGNKLHKARKQWGVYRQALGLPLPAALWYWMHYAFHGIVKYRRAR